MIQTEQNKIVQDNSWSRRVGQRKELNSFHCCTALLRSLVHLFDHLRFLRISTCCGTSKLSKLASIEKRFVSWALCDGTDAEAIGVCGHVSRAHQLLHTIVECFCAFSPAKSKTDWINWLQWDYFHVTCILSCIMLINVYDGRHFKILLEMHSSSCNSIVDGVYFLRDTVENNTLTSEHTYRLFP